MATLSDTFSAAAVPDCGIAIIENKLGDGLAILHTSLDYPGAGQTYECYRSVVRELLAASHRAADIKVFANDKVRFSVYESGDVYLLNTDFDIPLYAKIEKDGKVTEVTLAPSEMKHIKV